MAPRVTVIIPTHNPHPGRLQAVLLALRAQNLPVPEWETIVVNNASTQFPDTAFFAACAPANCSIVPAPELGLTAARRRGLAAAAAEFVVLADDDNVLAADYLEQTLRIFADHPRVGLAGGKSLPVFSSPPPDWTREFFPLLAVRDLGPMPIVSQGLRPRGEAVNQYPDFAPIGAGMALRRAAWQGWSAAPSRLSDRRGGELSSSGDNDIVLQAMRAGWEVGYFPQLTLQHLIPPERLTAPYLARLNFGIQCSWMQVLRLHEASPWGALSGAGARVRQARAWFTHRAWKSPAAHIRWRGACGHFAGLVR